ARRPRASSRWSTLRAVRQALAARPAWPAPTITVSVVAIWVSPPSQSRCPRPAGTSEGTATVAPGAVAERAPSLATVRRSPDGVLEKLWRRRGAATVDAGERRPRGRQRRATAAQA